MKSKPAWETVDGQTFFDKEKAEKHEENLRVKTAKESLTTLFEHSGFIPIEKARNLAQHVVLNVRLFATAISPLITKSAPKPKPTPTYSRPNDFCRRHDAMHPCLQCLRDHDL